MKRMNANVKRFLATCLMGTLLLAGNGLLVGGLLATVLTPSLPAYAEEGTEAIVIDKALGETTVIAAKDQEKEAALWEEMRAAYGENDVDWPLEAWAEFSQRREELGITLPDFVCGLPAADEVQLETAMATANAHLLAEMGFADEVLDRFSTDTKYLVTDPEKPYYQIAYSPRSQADYAEIGAYLVMVDGKTGDVTEFLTPADAVG